MFPDVKLPAQALQALFEDAISRATSSPHQGSYSLTIEGAECGHVFGPAVTALQSHPDVVLDDDATTLSISDRRQRGLDLTLDDVARTLDRAGCVPRWRGELLDLWTFDGRAIGSIERGVVRPLGLLTKAVHLNAWSATGGLWVARRSLEKPTDPGLWDTLVGGLVGRGEPPDLALERETYEEAGLSAEVIADRTPLRAIGQMRRRLDEGYQRELVLTSECVLPEGITPVNQDGESMTITCLAPQSVLQMLQNREFTVEASLVILEDLLFRVTGTRLPVF